MYFDFLNLGVTVNLPKGTKLFNKDQSVKLFKMDKTMAKTQLLHFASGDDKSNAMLFCLGEVRSNNDYKVAIEQFVSTSQKSGLKLFAVDKLMSTDGRRLDVQQLEGNPLNLLVVFSKINNRLFMLTNNHQAEHETEALNFGLEIMKTLAPIK